MVWCFVLFNEKRKMEIRKKVRDTHSEVSFWIKRLVNPLRSSDSDLENEWLFWSVFFAGESLELNDQSQEFE